MHIMGQPSAAWRRQQDAAEFVQASLFPTLGSGGTKVPLVDPQGSSGPAACNA